jgi:hypothetical protein
MPLGSTSSLEVISANFHAFEPTVEQCCIPCDSLSMRYIVYYTIVITLIPRYTVSYYKHDCADGEA